LSSGGKREKNSIRGAICPCAICEKKYSAISKAGSRRGGLFAAIRPSDRAPNRIAALTRLAAQYLSAQLMKNGAGRFLKPVCAHGMPFAAIRPSDRAPTAFAALRYGLSVQFLEKAVRFLQRRRFLLGSLLQPFTQSDCGA